jgi:hypothetical protein
MAGFRWRHQAEILVPYIDKFFAAVRRVFKEREKEFSSAFFSEVHLNFNFHSFILSSKFCFALSLSLSLYD